MDLAEASDSELWKKVIQGNVSAFASLHGRHIDRVYRHCFARLGDRNDADEAANQVFYEAWRKRRQVRLRPDASLTPWLLVVASNVVRNYTRSLRRRYALSKKLESFDSQQNEPVDIDCRLDAQRYTASLREAVRRLRPSSQRLIGLCVIEGLTYAEAAEVLEIPVGTVRSQLSRAKAQLRRELAREGADLNWKERL